MYGAQNLLGIFCSAVPIMFRLMGELQCRVNKNKLSRALLGKKNNHNTRDGKNHIEMKTFESY